MLCAAPFIHRFIFNDGLPNLCCAANRDPYVSDSQFKDWNGAVMQEIRRHMLEEDTLPSICSQCAEEEKVGLPSTRTVHNQTYKDLGEPELDIVTGTAIDAPLTLDLRMNNICNLSCRMCGPSSSSQLAKEAEKHPNLWPPVSFDRYNKFDPTEIIENAGAIFELKLLGGEPSLQPEAKALLQELISIGNTNIKLFITTNGTNYNKSFWGLVEKFSNVHVNVSIDAWEKQHEYIRGPAADWKSIWKNVEKISNISQIALQQTVTTLNIFDFWKLRKNSPFVVHSFACYLPEKYGIENMPLKWKERAINIAKENDAYEEEKHIFGLMMNDGKPHYMKGLKQYTELMDNVRGQHLIDYYPITWDMLEDIG